MKQIITVETTVQVPVIGGVKKSKFKTLEEWLISICDGKAPDKPISNYRISLSFSDSPSSRKYSLCMYGENLYTHENITHIDFEPSNMFLALPKKEYKNLDYGKVKEKITNQLKDFVETEKFKTSFLSKGSITLGYSGETIWTI